MTEITLNSYWLSGQLYNGLMLTADERALVAADLVGLPVTIGELEMRPDADRIVGHVTTASIDGDITVELRDGAEAPEPARVALGLSHLGSVDDIGRLYKPFGISIKPAED